jgi:tetratricopeptide (TPR) repeat protein
MNEENSLRALIEGHERFEEAVYKILMRSGAISVDWRRGGRDRARDLVAVFLEDGQTVSVYVECKFYSKSVSLSDIRNTLDWARVEQPNLVYLWIVPYLTPDTKDFLAKYEIESGVAVEYEDEAAIQEYLHDLESKDFSRIRLIHNKVFLASKRGGKIPAHDLEFEISILGTDHLLIDREEERRALSDEEYRAFYLYGVSGTGKTHLAKSLALQYHQNGRPVFWHTFNSGFDADAQDMSFLQAMGAFCANYKNVKFSLFLEQYGGNATHNLAHLAAETPFQARPVLFVDDFHKCKSGRAFGFLGQLLDTDDFDIVFMGWFNNLPHDFTVRHAVRFIPIYGLSRDHVSSLARHVLGTEPPLELLNVLISKCQGIPYFVTLANEMKACLHSDWPVHDTSEILHSVISTLTPNEADIIHVLSIARTPLSERAIVAANLGPELHALRRKKLVSESHGIYRVHDTLRQVVDDGQLARTLSLQMLNILEIEAATNVPVTLDLIDLYLAQDSAAKALEVFNRNFQKLLDLGYDASLLDLTTELLKRQIDISGLLCKKALILERSGEYNVASGLIQLVGTVQELVQDQKYDVLYTRIRLLYFENKFDRLLSLLTDAVDILSIELNAYILQILFLIGRVFHVRGDLEGAIYVYMYVVKLSVKTNSSLLFIKALHRIAMVEDSLGYVEEAEVCFSHLLGASLTRKREAYVLYRLAKCELTRGDYKAATEFNDKSIEIKVNFDHRRGLIFSWKLRAKILLAQGEPLDALKWVRKAYALAQQLRLDKEAVATGLVLISVLAALDRHTECRPVVDAICPVAQDLKLGHRLQTLNTLITQLNLGDVCEVLPLEQSTQRDEIIDRISSYLGEEYRLQIEELLAGTKAITPIIRDIFPI